MTRMSVTLAAWLGLVIFMTPLALGAGAAAAQPLCADPAASCRALVTTDCMDRLAAGAIALETVPGDCEGQRVAYVACVKKATVECASEGGGAGFAARSPQAGSARECDRCPEMIPLPSGAFMMGSAVANESPVHRVAVTQAIAMSEAEISFEEWDFCVADGGCAAIDDDGGWGRGGQPVVNVTYEQARRYADWLTARAGRRYRLPTEAEWEYAARAGGGAAVGVNCRDCGGKRGQPVASGAANAFGLVNMVGNVAEWTADCRTADYSRAPAEAHVAPIDAGCLERVTRGGSWADRSAAATASNRSFRKTTIASKAIGFRVVREE